jgi:hypothetical protein
MQMLTNNLICSLAGFDRTSHEAGKLKHFDVKKKEKLSKEV